MKQPTEQEPAWLWAMRLLFGYDKLALYGVISLLFWLQSLIQPLKQL